jgi:hypothetical protein
MKEKDFDIYAFIENLRGTCKSLAEGCEDFGIHENDLSEDDYSRIDQEIFVCETCNWWCEQGEQAEDQDEICSDCAED